MIPAILLTCIMVILAVKAYRMGRQPVATSRVLTPETFAYWMKRDRMDFERQGIAVTIRKDDANG